MILDIIVIAIIILSLIIGYKLGAARALLTLVGYIVSFLLATFFGEYLANFIYSTYLGPSIVTSVSDSISNQFDNSLVSIEQLPAFVRFSINLTGFDCDLSKYKDTSTVPQAIASGFESAVKPIVISVLSFVLIAVIFLIVFLLYRIFILKILLKLFKLPIIHSIDSVLGAVCSLIIAVLLISFVAFLLKMIMPFTTDMPYILSESTIYNSYIFYHFYSGNIFYTLLSVF